MRNLHPIIKDLIFTFDILNKMPPVKELVKKLKSLFKQVNDLKEQIKENDDKIDSLRTTSNKAITDLKAELNDKQDKLNNMQDCDKFIKEVQQLQIDSVLLKHRVSILENLVQKQSQQINTLKKEHY